MARSEIKELTRLTFIVRQEHYDPYYDGFFGWLKSLFRGGGVPQEEAFWIYLHCRRCGEVIKTRLDLLNSLALNHKGGYTASKMLVGNRLYFKRIEITLTFDENCRLINREILRGDFITAEEFEAGQSHLFVTIPNQKARQILLDALL